MDAFGFLIYKITLNIQNDGFDYDILYTHIIVLY